MKRILFYFIILVQILFIASIGLQNMLIDRYGKEIKLHVTNRYGDYWADYNNYLYVEYDASKVSHNKWDIDPNELYYNDRVYILLEQDDEGFYVPKKASTKKMKSSDNEVILPAKYLFVDNNPTVEYGLERIHKRVFRGIHRNKPFTVVINVAPWGQRKIVEMVQE